MSIVHTILTDMLLSNTEPTSPARRRSLFHSFRLADHGLHADLLHEIVWRVSSPADPQTAVVVSVVPPWVPLSYSRSRRQSRERRLR